MNEKHEAERGIITDTAYGWKRNTHMRCEGLTNTGGAVERVKGGKQRQRQR